MLGEILKNTRAARPLVHCISNLVTANDCANLMLAAGASPIMAEAPEEVAEIAAMCAGEVLNLGTPNPAKLEAMALAGREANRRNRPVVFDPVGVGSSALRKHGAQRLMQAVHFAAIRGNSTEITSLLHGTQNHRGVDADEGEALSCADAVQLARQTGAVVIVTGSADLTTDGFTVYRVGNGHAMMRSVTGAGCMLSALTGVYLAANPDRPLQAALAAVCAMGLAGELAHARLSPQDGNATFRNYIIDAIYNMTPEQLEEGAKYEIQ